MKNNKLIIVTLPFIIFLGSCESRSYSISSCDGVDTSKSGPYDLSSISIVVNHYQNGESLVQPIGLDIADKNIEIVVSSEQNWLSNNFNIWNILIPVANACSLIAPYGVSNIIDFKVIIINSQNAEKDVSSFFNIVKDTQSNNPELPAVVSDYVATSPPVSRSYTLQANENMNINGEYTFKVFLSTSSGNDLSSSIGPFNIVGKI